MRAMRLAMFLGLTLMATAAPAVARSPVVVELYTAQGCASCREANINLGKLAEQPGVLALTFSVDYWDYLGWPDTFAKPEFSDRQKAYEARFGLREPYTPQVVINGRAQAGGQQADKIDKLIQTAARNLHAPAMAFVGNRRVDVGSGPVPRGGAEVWLVRYDKAKLDVQVKTGDNRGQTVSHVQVVRELRRLGSWSGRPTAYRMPSTPTDGLATAVLVQGVRGGRILGALSPQ